jgi:hypothetical protein
MTPKAFILRHKKSFLDQIQDKLARSKKYTIGIGTRISFEFIFISIA